LVARALSGGAAQLATAQAEALALVTTQTAILLTTTISPCPSRAQTHLLMTLTLSCSPNLTTHFVLVLRTALSRLARTGGSPFIDDVGNPFVDDDLSSSTPPEGENPFASKGAAVTQRPSRSSFRSCCFSRASSVSHPSRRPLPVTELGRGLRADVARLTSATSRVHDRRSLCLIDGRLHVYDKGSLTKVKTLVDVKEDVEDCQCLHGNVLSVVLQRVPRGRSRQDGVMEVKSYFFSLRFG